VAEDAPLRVFIVGPMGSGKSTVGKQLATLMSRDFIDSDTEIETRCGADIPWIFDVEGEAGFRRRETAVLRDLAERESVVIATGGGAILAEENRALMSSSGVVIYLDVSVAQQVQRTGTGEGRPLLQQGDRRATLNRLMAEREPLYRALADVIISAGAGSARKIALQIQRQLKERSLVP